MSQWDSRFNPDFIGKGFETEDKPLPFELPQEQLIGLARLLGDEDPHIHHLAYRELSHRRKLALPVLIELSKEKNNPALRSEIVKLVREWKSDDYLNEWQNFASKPDPLDLETGVWLLEAVENVSIDIEKCRSKLDDLAKVLEKRIPADRDPLSIVNKLNHLLFRELQIKGNRESYYEPQNSFLSAVLTRRLGIPISLSVLCILIAKRIGVEINGVGLPRHFLLKYRNGGKDLFFDPFNAGREWSFQDCLEHLKSEGYPLEESYLNACTPRKILTRMLANLLNIYNQNKDKKRRHRTEKMLSALTFLGWE